MKQFQNSLVAAFFLMLSPFLQGSALAESLFIGGVSFEIPAEWAETKASSPMRTAQYKIPKAETDPEDGELAVFFFGEGQGGDINANIVRWQQQFELTDDKAGQIEKKIINGVPVTSVHFEGTYKPGAMSSAHGADETKKDYAFSGAIISGSQGQIFLKLLAPRKTMESAHASFQKMLESIQSTMNA